MAYRYGNRCQMTLLPQSIEDYIPEDDPVRAYDAFVEAINLNQLGLKINPYKVGNSEYDPKAMLKLFVYGYSYGVKSSRKLERAIYHNLSFIWLMGGLKPDHKTIAEFRRKNKGNLKKILKQCARMCIKLNLIAGNTLFVDGTKIRANASAARTHDKAWYEKQLKQIDQHIESLLEECEAIDQHEAHMDSCVEMDKKLTQAKKLKESITEILSEFQETERQKINQTDPDCANMRSIQGKHASYNVQSVVDDENGLILHAEAVNDTNDINQFASQVERAHDVLDKQSHVACADAGYTNADELEKINAQGIKVIVPSRRQAHRKASDPFDKQAFTFNKDHDCYYCPEGHQLTLSSIDKKKGDRYYQITDKQICHKCPHYGSCTTGKCGRRLFRMRNETLVEKFECQYAQEASQKIYAKRKARVEHPFGHIKKNLQTDAFLMRGNDGVQAETSLLATCFNITRMISILGVVGFIGKMSAVMA